MVCEELGGLGTTFIQDMLNFLSNTIEPYILTQISDPLSLQNNVDVPSDITLVDFLDTSENRMSSYVSSFLDQVNTYLGSPTNETTNSNGNQDLVINVALRALLDDDGSYVIDVDEYYPDSALIYEGEDMLTKTTMTIKGIQVYGLDSITHIDILEPLASQTLQSSVNWEELIISVTLEIVMKPSTTSDSVIVDSTSQETTEHVTIKMKASMLSSVITIFAAFDYEILRDLKFGSIINNDDAMACIVSSLYDEIVMTQMIVEVASLSPPDLSGFISIGIDKIVSSASAIAYDLYEPAIVSALPAFFDKTVKKMLNELIASILTNDQYNTCPSPLQTLDKEYIDYRDLFMKPAKAKESGASGTEPYGNVMRKAKEIFLEKLVSSQEGSNNLRINR